MAYFYGLEADDDFDDPEDDLRLYGFSLEEDDWVPYEVVKLRQFGFPDDDIFDLLTGYEDDILGTGDRSDSSFGVFQFDPTTNSLLAARARMGEGTTCTISRKTKSFPLSKNPSTTEIDSTDSGSIELCTLQELCCRFIGRWFPFEFVQEYPRPVPTEVQTRIAYWSFPSKPALSSWLAMNACKRVRHKANAIQVTQIAQTGLYLLASFRDLPKVSTSVQVDRGHITDVKCTCATGPWCEHVYALCMARINKSCPLHMYPPISESLIHLNRDQLQKLLQYVCSRIPLLVLPEVHDVLSTLQDKDAEINHINGAPDITAGGTMDHSPQWMLNVAHILHHYTVTFSNLVSGSHDSTKHMKSELLHFQRFFHLALEHNCPSGIVSPDLLVSMLLNHDKNVTLILHWACDMIEELFGTTNPRNEEKWMFLVLCHIFVPVVEIFTVDSATSKGTKEELLSSVQSCALACQSTIPCTQLQKIEALIQFTMDDDKMATVSSHWNSDTSTVELTSLASNTSEAEVAFSAIMATLSYRMYHGMPALLHCVRSCCTMLFPTPAQGASSIAELVSVNKLLGHERRAVILRYGMGLAEALKSIHSLEADSVLVDLIFKLLSSGVFTSAPKNLQHDFHEEVVCNKLEEDLLDLLNTVTIKMTSEVSREFSDLVELGTTCLLTVLPDDTETTDGQKERFQCSPSRVLNLLRFLVVIRKRLPDICDFVQKLMGALTRSTDLECTHECTHDQRKLLAEMYRENLLEVLKRVFTESSIPTVQLLDVFKVLSNLFPVSSSWVYHEASINKTLYLNFIAVVQKMRKNSHMDPSVLPLQLDIAEVTESLMSNWLKEASESSRETLTEEMKQIVLPDAYAAYVLGEEYQNFICSLFVYVDMIGDASKLIRFHLIILLLRTVKTFSPVDLKLKQCRVGELRIRLETLLYSLDGHERDTALIHMSEMWQYCISSSVRPCDIVKLLANVPWIRSQANMPTFRRICNILLLILEHFPTISLHTVQEIVRFCLDTDLNLVLPIIRHLTGCTTAGMGSKEKVNFMKKLLHVLDQVGQVYAGLSSAPQSHGPDGNSSSDSTASDLKEAGLELLRCIGRLIKNGPRSVKVHNIHVNVTRVFKLALDIGPEGLVLAVNVIKDHFTDEMTQAIAVLPEDVKAQIRSEPNFRDLCCSIRSSVKGLISLHYNNPSVVDCQLRKLLNFYNAMGLNLSDYHTFVQEVIKNCPFNVKRMAEKRFLPSILPLGHQNQQNLHQQKKLHQQQQTWYPRQHGVYPQQQAGVQQNVYPGQAVYPWQQNAYPQQQNVYPQQQQATSHASSSNQPNRYQRQRQSARSLGSGQRQSQSQRHQRQSSRPGTGSNVKD